MSGLTTFLSIVQFLEQRISELERTHASADQGSGYGAGASQDDDFFKFADFCIASRMRSDMLTDQSKLLHAPKLFYPSERPPLKIPVRGIYYDVRPRTAGRGYSAQFSHLHALKIPVHVAKRLFANYRNDILPQFPCFMEDHLAECFQQFYNDPAAPERNNKSRLSDFVVPMVLAISCLTSNDHHFSKVAALSEALQRDAMRHMAIIRHSSIQALQCILLLIQHALLLPYAANLWYLTGEAMRMAVSLGLHQEPHPTMVDDPADAELRRRLFWMVGPSYSLARLSECPTDNIRSRSISLTAPSAFPVDVPLPSVTSTSQLNFHTTAEAVMQIWSNRCARPPPHTGQRPSSSSYTAESASYNPRSTSCSSLTILSPAMQNRTMPGSRQRQTASRSLPTRLQMILHPPRGSPRQLISVGFCCTGLPRGTLPSPRRLCLMR